MNENHGNTDASTRNGTDDSAHVIPREMKKGYVPPELTELGDISEMTGGDVSIIVY